MLSSRKAPSHTSWLFAALCAGVVLLSLWRLRWLVETQRLQLSGAAAMRPATFTVVVTMDCSVYSEWQAVMAIGSLQTLREAHPERPFRIVRLVSCNAGEAGLHERTRAYGDEIRISPALGDPYPFEPMKGFVYPPLQKSFAIAEWLANATSAQALADNDELVLVDTDFVFLRLPTFGVSALGRPAGSGHYFLGGDWLDRKNGELRPFCSAACDNVTSEVVARDYDAGAPYYVRAGDLRRLAPLWYEKTLAMVLAADIKVAWSTPGGWLADMYAYSLAAIELDLPHRLLHDQMVYIVDHLNLMPPDVDVPVALHFCQNYNLSGVAYFAKHDWHQESLLDCAAADEYAFWRRYPYAPTPELLADTPPPLDRSRTTEGAERRLLWIVWHLRFHFGAQLRQWRRVNCGQ